MTNFYSIIKRIQTAVEDTALGLGETRKNEAEIGVGFNGAFEMDVEEVWTIN